MTTKAPALRPFLQVGPMLHLHTTGKIYNNSVDLSLLNLTQRLAMTSLYTVVIGFVLYVIKTSLGVVVVDQYDDF